MISVSSLHPHAVEMKPSSRVEVISQESTIIVGTILTLEASIDPAQAYDKFGWDLIGALSSGLVEIIPNSGGGDDDIQGALAESWSVNPAGTEWTFNLRDELTFVDGYPFNASVVEYTFNRNCNLTGEGLYEPAGPQLNMGYGDIIDNVEVVSEYVVKFNLQVPFAPFLQLLSCPASYIVHPSYAPMKEWITYNSSLTPRENHPNGLGPYILTTWDRIGGYDTRMVLEANMHYWDYPNLPKNDKIVINFYADETALAAAMTAGEIDVAYRYLSPAQIWTFKSDTDVTVWEGTGATIQYLCFQQNIYPYNETPVRQAIAAALNRTHVATTVFEGTVDPLYSIIPQGMAYHKPSFAVYGEANYSFTQDMLAPYGFNATNKLVIELYYESSGHYPLSAEQALVNKVDLEASGVITCNLNYCPWPEYRLQRNQGTMEVFIYGWYPDFIDPDNYGFLPFASWLSLDYNETYPEGGIDQFNLWTAGRSETNSTLREEIYYQLQDLQAEEVSIIPLWQDREWIVSDDDIQGVVIDITEYWRPWLYYDVVHVSSTTSSSSIIPTTSSSTAISTTSSSTTIPTSSSSTTTSTSTTTNTTGTWEYFGTMTIVIIVGSIGVIVVVVMIIRPRRF
ncbi:MAG: ABC transporter substrate-binding protein [Candidatus Thorarchaeota archaeon]